jgi:hypothetical protein
MDLSSRFEHLLPLKGRLTLAYLVSIVIAVVMTVGSLAGLLYGPGIYPGLEAKLLPLFVGQDALNLVVGLPMLLGSMWLARRGSLVGLLLWPGALFYILYDYGYYVLGAPFNLFFLAYIALMTLSSYAMIGIVASIDGGAVRERLAGSVPSSLVGGILIALALLFTMLWTSMTVSALLGGAPLDPVPHVVVIMDLTVQLPALLVGGVLMWRREPLGYVVAVGLLLQAGVYLAGLSAITILQEVATGAPFDAMAVVPGFAVGAVCLGLIRPFVRGAVDRREVATFNVKVADPAPAKT